MKQTLWWLYSDWLRANVPEILYKVAVVARCINLTLFSPSGNSETPHSMLDFRSLRLIAHSCSLAQESATRKLEEKALEKLPLKSCSCVQKCRSEQQLLYLHRRSSGSTWWLCALSPSALRSSWRASL